MEKQERIQIEITTNTVRYLLHQFDKLLLGLDTKKYEFGSVLEKKRKIKAIRDFTDYRIKEKIIDKESDLWKLLKEIKVKDKDIANKKVALSILERLLHLHTKGMYRQPIYLDSKEAKQISLYIKQKSREDNQKAGLGVLRRLAGFFES